MTASRSVIFAEPVRTALGTFGGGLKDVPAPQLGAIAIKAALNTGAAGTFSGAVDFGDGPLLAKGGRDVFVVKDGAKPGKQATPPPG